MNIKTKRISIVTGSIFIILILVFLKSKEDTLFSEKIIAEVSDQLGEDLESFFVPLQEDFSEITEWPGNEDLTVGNEMSLIKKWYGFFVSHPLISAVVCRESGGHEFVIYRDKGSYVTSLRVISDKADSVYTWKRYKNPDQEISRWNEIVKIGASGITVKLNKDTSGDNSITWNGDAKSDYTGKPVLQGTFSIGESKSITIEIPVSEIVNALTRFRWYKDRRIFIETMDGDYIQIPELKKDTLVFISKTNMPELAKNDSVYYFIIQSLKIGDAGNVNTHTFDLGGDRWWIQTTVRYPVSYGIAIKEDQLVTGKIKQHLFYILGLLFIAFMLPVLLYIRKYKKHRHSSSEINGSEEGDHYWELLIQKGEEVRLEFKASLRWDLKENMVNQRLEEVVLKTIAAFSNGEGGMLMIGVDDNGVVLGLEADYNSLKKSGPDYFELHLRNLLNTKFGISFTTNNIRIEFPVVYGKQICVIHIEKAEEPVFLEMADKLGKKSEKFYVRSGNSSQEIQSLSELNTYIGRRFGNSS